MRPALRLSLGLLGRLGLTRREIAAKSKRDSAGDSEVALIGSAVVLQVTGEYVIGRPQLDSDVAKEPIINARTSACRQRRIGQRNPGGVDCRPVLTNQAVHKNVSLLERSPIVKRGPKRYEKLLQFKPVVPAQSLS